jgi:NhaP-type Na+/H+ or K+/H+ antiporter
MIELGAQFSLVDRIEAEAVIISARRDILTGISAFQFLITRSVGKNAPTKSAACHSIPSAMLAGIPLGMSDGWHLREFIRRIVLRVLSD